MSNIARYIVVLDRHIECGDDHIDKPFDTELEGREQVAKELQEVMDKYGLPVGTFRVVARQTVEFDRDAENISMMDDDDAHRLATVALEQTRTY